MHTCVYVCMYTLASMVVQVPHDAIVEKRWRKERTRSPKWPDSWCLGVQRGPTKKRISVLSTFESCDSHHGSKRIRKQQQQKKILHHFRMNAGRRYHHNASSRSWLFFWFIEWMQPFTELGENTTAIRIIFNSREPCIIQSLCFTCAGASSSSSSSL